MAMKKSDKEYHDKLRDLGCIACWLDGRPKVPTEIHHPRYGAGMGQKMPHIMAIPLCHKHHRGTDHPKTSSVHLSPLAFTEKYGAELELWKKVQKMIEPSQFTDGDF
jgi:hypothetical protein